MKGLKGLLVMPGMLVKPDMAWLETTYLTGNKTPRKQKMPKITFIAHDGTRREIQASSGESLMLAAVNNRVTGIDADCGGLCACATCHVFVDPHWAAQLPPISPKEEEMLNFTAERREESRLSCQILVIDALDGLTVVLPIGQH